jgi:hypothetical protein
MAAPVEHCFQDLGCHFVLILGKRARLETVRGDLSTHEINHYGIIGSAKDVSRLFLA